MKPARAITFTIGAQPRAPGMWGAILGVGLTTANDGTWMLHAYLLTLVASVGWVDANR